MRYMYKLLASEHKPHLCNPSLHTSLHMLQIVGWGVVFLYNRLISRYAQSCVAKPYGLATRDQICRRDCENEAWWYISTEITDQLTTKQKPSLESLNVQHLNILLILHLAVVFLNDACTSFFSLCAEVHNICFKTGPLQCLRDVPQSLMFLTII